MNRSQKKGGRTPAAKEPRGSTKPARTAGRSLTSRQISRLEAQGCSAEDWVRVTIDPSADLGRIVRVRFQGTVSVGGNDGSVVVDGVTVPCGLYDATIVECAIGRSVRIARIGSAVAGYDIGDNSVIEDVAALTADAGATFGAGTEVEAINEAGGRVAVLMPELTAQLAYLQTVRRHDPELTAALRGLVASAVGSRTGARGNVGEGARIVHAGPIRNVHVGRFAVVTGPASLENGTILSCKEHPTSIGAAVHAKSFIVAEGAAITAGALIDKCYVGQAVKMGKQFSAEHCLFFANCEAFHGEAVAVLAGPYTVTHHKSTLLIAGLFSFYNAGSGTNQSNHMYKLGPVHQGVFERGCKTGSFSYVMHETHVGAFTTVIGKHYTNVNTPDLPFSLLQESGGQSTLVPGMMLQSIGTVRDGEKWPKRDGRKSPVRRDLIVFDVFSPYTVQKMRRGRDLLQQLADTTPREKLTVNVGGVVVKRLLLKTGAKYYRQAVTRYLCAAVLDRISLAAAQGPKGSKPDWMAIRRELASASRLKDPLAWTDIAGLLTPVERLTALERSIAGGALRSVDEVTAGFASMFTAYRDDEWEYVCAAFETEFGAAPADLSVEQARDAVRSYGESAAALASGTLDDSRKEFEQFARIGFGVDMTDDERARDFEAVRGSAASNAVVQKMTAEKTSIEERVRSWSEVLATL